MKLHKLSCPNCNGIMNIKITDNISSVFCPYRGQQFLVDDEKKEYTVNKKISVNKNTHDRYTDDAKILKEIISKKIWIIKTAMKMQIKSLAKSLANGFTSPNKGRVYMIC